MQQEVVQYLQEYKMEKLKPLSIIILQIALLLGTTFAVSYILHESTIPAQIVRENKQPSTKFIIISLLIKNLINFIFNDKNLVSATATITVDDLSKGAYTCIKSKSGKSCQEFPSSQCATECDGVCVPSPRKDVSECKPGTCYDSTEGTCQTGSPKSTCEPAGKWFDDPYGNIPQCRKGCCILGGEQTFFSSPQQCARKAAVLGLSKEFRQDVSTEIACLVLANSQEEGACVYDFEFEKTCKFETKSSCLEQRGEFHIGLLCSNPSLNTNCEKQKKVACIQGKDGLYWFDSCGNRENIYDANKIRSYNNGKLLAKNESCSVGTSTNPLANQKTCGNCDYLMGSTCGDKTSSEKLSDSSQDFVCRDLRCRDDKGVLRENGESWCAYQGSIGTDKGASNLLRGTDTPGSGNFRKVCFNGEIRTEPCADYRNEICVQSDLAITGGKTFSSAACRLNRWQQCVDYNTEVKKGDKKAGELVRDDKCLKNPDCFIKEVKVSDNFKFKLCAPKYPPGFNLVDNGEAGQELCSLANQKCTVVYVKGLGGWECKANCDCETKKFAEQMNDLCTSLGDCGTEANYQGDLTTNSKIYKNGKLQKNIFSTQYTSKLKTYATPQSGMKPADPGNLTEMFGELGFPGGLGSPGDIKDPNKIVGTLGMISGLGGIMILAGVAAYAYLTTGVGVAAGYSGFSGLLVGGFNSMSPALGGFMGALAGAAIGVAVVSIMIKMLGIGAGLPPELVYTLMAAGAVAGAMAAMYLLNLQVLGAACSNPVTCLAGIVIVIIILVIFKLLGIGDVEKITYKFQCNPWQPQNGGSKCSQCGKDVASDGSTPQCTRYACQSLGQTCEFINEGTDQQACVDINPNDASAPQIKPMQSALQPGFSYSDVSANGFKVKSSEECIKAYSPLSFGIQLNEPGYCKMDTEHTPGFDDMEFDFGGSTLYKTNHTTIFNIPSIESLGLPGYDPNRRADYSLYVRCQDKKGNKNVNEYTINFCVKPGDDLTPPIVTAREPLSEWLAYNATEQESSIFTNEPAECKYDSQNKDYDQMSSSFACSNAIIEQEPQGWKCDATFPIEKNDSIFYVRCKDQPRLVETGTKHRNKNMESYQFILKRTTSNLQIDSITPDNETITSGVEPVSVEVKVETSGGVDGTATCSYKMGNSYIEFFETLGSTHKQVFQSFYSGDKVLPVRCEDLAGNVVERTASFNIQIDTTAPEITRVYQQSGLYIVTNEPSECFFITSSPNDANSCNFNIENSTQMSGLEFVHTAPLDNTLTHYIKCKDSFGNLPGTCSIVVRKGI